MSVIDLDLTLVSGKAVATAEALRDGRNDTVKTLYDLNRLVVDLNRAALAHARPSVGEREIHFATGFLLQAIERWARYQQYQHEQARADDWREAAFAFVALVRNAVAREHAKVSA